MALSDWLLPRNKVANRSNTVTLGKASSGRHSRTGGLGTCAFCSNQGRFEAKNSKGTKIKVCTTHRRILS